MCSGVFQKEIRNGKFLYHGHVSVLKNIFKNRIFCQRKVVHVRVCVTVQAHMSECIIAIY